jgi:hypothetical protein
VTLPMEFSWRAAGAVAAAVGSRQTHSRRGEQLYWCALILGFLLGDPLWIVGALVGSLGIYTRIYRSIAEQAFLAHLGFFIAAGLTVPQALGAAASVTQAPLREAADALHEEWTALKSPRDALDRFVRRVPLPEARTLADAIRQDIALGYEMSAVLARQAEAASNWRIHRLRKQLSFRPYILTVVAGLLLVYDVILVALPRLQELLPLLFPGSGLGSGA